MPFASRLFTRRTLVLASGTCAVGLGLGFGCGGGGATSTGTGTFSAGGASGSSGSAAQGGDGGMLFHPTTSSGSSGTGTGTGSTSSSGSMPVCDGTTPTTGPAQWAVKNDDDPSGQNALAIATDVAGNVVVTGSYSGTLTLGGKTAEVTSAANALFVAKLGSDGKALWVHGYAATTFSGLHSLPHSAGQGIAVDALGNVYVTGEAYGHVNLGAGQSVQSGTEFSDVFLLKLDSSGNTTASARIGDPAGTPTQKDAGQTARTLALLKSTSGDVIAIGGDSQNTIDIGGGKTAVAPGGEKVAYVAAFSASTLAPQFVALFGDGSIKQELHAMTFDKNHDLLVTGNTAGAITFPGGTALTPAGTQAAFVAKLKSDGSATVWAKLYGSGTAGGTGIASSAAGDVFITGNHKGDIDFGGGVLPNNFGDNVYVARLEGGGGEIWSHTYGDSKAQQAHGITVDSTGRATVVGDYTGKLDFGGGALIANNQDAFAVKLDTHGCQVWAKSLGDSSVQSASAVAVDSTDNLVLTGLLFGSITVGSTTLTAGAGEAAGDMFVAKFAP
jgi:hypothetical protein